MIVSDFTSTRELHSRIHHGIQVRLLWSKADGGLWVGVHDIKAAGGFTVEIRDHAAALDVFHHPYAYAAHHRVDTGSSAPDPAAFAAILGD